MIDIEQIKSIVCRGLKEYLNCTVFCSNQNTEKPSYPYISYTVTTPMSENKGTYGEYSDGMARKAVTQTWSITALSDKDLESLTLANKAREWLDYAGSTYLNDNGVIVQSVTAVNNRDNLLTVGYEYRNGFDVFFTCFDEVTNIAETTGIIETIDLMGERVEAPPTMDELTERLAQRLTGVI